MAKLQRGNGDDNSDAAKRSARQWIDRLEKMVGRPASLEVKRWVTMICEKCESGEEMDPDERRTLIVGLGYFLECWKLEVPSKWGDVVATLRLEYNEARYQSETLNPLRERALTSARELRQALSALSAAETSRPIVKFYDEVAALPNAPTLFEGLTAEEPPDAVRLASLGEVLLPYLIDRLQRQMAQFSRKRGRPTDLARNVQKALAPNALSDGRMAAFLRLVQLEGADNEGARNRVRHRRRRAR